MYYNITISRLYRLPVFVIVSNTPIYSQQSLWADDVTVLRRRTMDVVMDTVALVSRRTAHAMTSRFFVGHRDVVVSTAWVWYHVHIPPHTTHVMTSFTERVPGDSHMNFHKISINFISSSSTTLIIDCSLNYLNGHLCMRILASRNFKRWSTYDVTDNSLTIICWTIN